MAELRAFVGHSFSEHDKALVGIFCEHFDNLSKANLNFSWDHAVGAEPSPLSQKVIAKIEGKNVFIGICTRNELAIRDSLLRPGFFRRQIRCAESTSFEWKTSDWIIQEIGLAVGRKMSVIIFLEEGVREPGGLYGDMEYISFSRINPQASFDKLLQMLLSLKPKESIGSTAGDMEPPQSEQAKLLETALRDIEPRSDWSKEQYDSAMISVVLQRDAVALEQITEAFLASKYSVDLGAVEWEGRIEWLRIVFGDQGDFEKLKRLAVENIGSSQLYVYLARGYDSLGEHGKAAEAFQKASFAAASEADKASYNLDAAIQFARTGELSCALNLFEQAKKIAISHPEVGETIAEDLGALAQIEKNDELELAALERAVELRPADWKLRFQVAYKHSQCENGDMALYHYSKIPYSSRDSTVWNNIGVSFAEFSMPVKSNSAFRRSEAMLDTLAMANIGFRLLRSGFLDEASNLAKKALGFETYHLKVTELLKRIKEIPEEEDEKETDALTKVKPKAFFYRQFGGAALAETPIRMGSKWQAPEGVLDASLNGADVSISGSYEQDENIFGGLLGGIARRKVTRRIQYTLKLRGNILVGEVRRTADGEASPTIAALGLANQKVMMYFDSGEIELRVLEGSSFYSMKCVD